ncbi:hypothetical protein IP84_16885 [beta proteobacterium AAP99]|nr:hypothetical protein IP84_16885 [beta proteobacterium AAP99]
MSPAEIGLTSIAMRKYGGAFVRKLGEALEVADQYNAQTLEIAFPVYFKKYGPGSEFYGELTHHTMKEEA